MSEKKTVLAFGFSKTKTKTTLVKNDTTTKTFGFESSSKTEKIELISSIEGKKVKSISQPDVTEVKPLVIPCIKNQIQIISNKSKEPAPIQANPEDLEAVRALLADSINAKKEENNSNLSIPIDKLNEKEVVEDPNYDAVGVEQFGMAALRGMGWNEKEGIGLTNKRVSSMVEPELRPKGLGLGAGSAKKPKSEENKSEETENGLRYIKNAYVQITAGKNKDEYGQIVGFDNGLDRIIIKLGKSDQSLSFLQNCTRLVSKSEFLNATEGRDRRKK